MRSNAIAPAARTRLTEATPGLSEVVKAPEDGFDVWDPANVSPFVAYLATADCPFTGETFIVQGGTVQRVQSWSTAEKIEKNDRWTVAELAAEAPKLAKPAEGVGAGAPGSRIASGDLNRSGAPLAGPFCPSRGETRALFSAHGPSDLLFGNRSRSYRPKYV